MNKIGHVLREIIDTESSYVKGLENLEKHFITPIVSTGENLNQVSIFLNSFYPILTLHQTMLVKMSDDVPKVIEDRSIDDCLDIVVNALTEHAALFKLYISYLQYFDVSVQTLSDLGKKEPFKSIYLSAYSNPELRNQTLDSLLILPVQRIPRYELLIKELIKQTSKANNSNDIIKKLSSALIEVETLALTCNKNIANYQKDKQVWDLWESFGKDDRIIKVPRDLIKDGELDKLKKKSGASRRIILFSNVLLIGKSKNNIYEISFMTDLKWININILSDLFPANSFNVTSPAKSYTFICKTKEERQEWTTAVQDAVDKRKSIKDKCSSCNNINNTNNVNNYNESNVVNITSSTNNQLILCQQCSMKICSNCTICVELTIGSRKVVAKICSSCHSIQNKEMKPNTNLNSDDLIKLPYGWETKKINNEVVYYNNITKLSSFLHPSVCYQLDLHYVDDVLPENCRRCYDRDGNIFYQNLCTGETSWTKPLVSTNTP